MLHYKVQRFQYRIHQGIIWIESIEYKRNFNFIFPLETRNYHLTNAIEYFEISITNRYTDLGDIFSEIGDISVSAPASANLSKINRQIPTPTSASSIAIPRPPSRRSETAVRGRTSPSNSSISRADSVGSLEFRTAFGSSRGPSPLTIGITDTIPLAVAFHEIVHAYFRYTYFYTFYIKYFM